MKLASLARTLCSTAALALLAIAATAQSGYKFELLTLPGLSGPDGIMPTWSSYVQSINNNGDMIAFWTDAGGANFSQVITRKGKDISFTIPGALWIDYFDINNEGTVSGDYFTADGIAHGFSHKSNGKVVNYTLPGAPFTTLLSVAESGLTLGLAGDPFNFSEFLLLPNGTKVDLNYPVSGFDLIQWNSVNNAGTIAGTWYTDITARALIGKNGQSTEIVIPTSIWTSAIHINNRGEVAGEWETSEPDQIWPYAIHGYVRSASGEFTNVDYAYSWPQSVAMPVWWSATPIECTFLQRTGTEIFAQNDRGQLVGQVSAIYITEFGWFELSRLFIATPNGADNHSDG